MNNPAEILEQSYKLAQKAKAKSFVAADEFWEKIEFLCRCNTNKAPIRLLMSCLLAKLHDPAVDIRKPYTEIGGKGTFSGRHYDELYIEAFVHKHKLPCNPTTAYLTPAFRNIDRILKPDLEMVGRPKEAYTYTLEIIDAVHKNKERADNVLNEIVRYLIVVKDENEQRMGQLIAGLKQTNDFLPLSSEEIIILIAQHLQCKNASRLPVLIVAAAYITASDKIGELPLPLHAHTAADKQTGSVGDVEITLKNDEAIVTCYEMKDKPVSRNDIVVALQKLAKKKIKIDNYIFITTGPIDKDVADYAKSLYEPTGVEFAILDCIGFMRHYLHFFHRLRNSFLNIYQELVLAEPSSSVTQPLKEAFLALRRTAESDR
ncbi:restriction endonuclease, SacI family [candidate division TA06 bacterium]|uniref:Restriction endonuclease, SacI family n=1 Tax=candidate division TA06 bacterium TaxID=2250710 RepID=A0A933I979_UNCT6|nr:restriction endonuclease, SacI family [candidate division TA06 bacterium]